jgi:UPF0716 family protein affecting phage T7 exclusion
MNAIILAVLNELGTVNLVACLVTERIVGLFAVRWEGLGWWGLRRRRTGGFASRLRSSATGASSGKGG